MPDIHVRLKGGCICGEVRYEVDAVTEARQHVLCHCADCRRVTGTGHSQTVGVPEELVSLTGAESLRSYTLKADSGNAVDSCFCSRCGAPLFRRYREPRMDIVAARGKILALHAGSLDEDCIDAYRPDMKLGLDVKPDWDNYI